jgi:hypothetical protein
MAIWKNESDGSLHDDCNGEALSLPTWPTGLVELTAEEAYAAQHPAPTAQQLAEKIRAERNAILAKCDMLTTRHRDQKDIGLTTTLTDAQYSDVLTYKQALRDMVDNPKFPESITWPKIPIWFTP